jgi:hypothetical protein
MLLCAATSFENGYPTTEEMVCSAFSEERVCNNCNVHFAYNFTWNHPAEYPFMSGTRNSSREGAFAKAVVQISPLCV